jgi:hypothetical protein
MFTVYMTLSNIGHVAGNKLAGPVREGLQEPLFALSRGSAQADWVTAYQQTFLFVAVASVLPLFFLPLVDPMNVDPHKYPSARHSEPGA